MTGALRPLHVRAAFERGLPCSWRRSGIVQSAHISDAVPSLATIVRLTSLLEARV